MGLHRASIQFQLDFYGIYNGFLWFFMVSPWDLKKLLDFHEVSMEPLWHLYGILVGFLEFLKGFP